MSGRTNKLNVEEIRCFCCGQKGHYSTDCEKTNSIARYDWWLEKPENIYLKKNFRKKEKEYEDRKINWSGCQVRTRPNLHQKQKKRI